jgi:hypothetical protein
MIAAVKAKTKTEDIPVQEKPPEPEPVNWRIPVGALELLERISRALNKINREVLWLTYAREQFSPPEIHAFEVILEDGAPVRRIRIVDRAVELGVLDLVNESPQIVGETLP